MGRGERIFIAEDPRQFTSSVLLFFLVLLSLFLSSLLSSFVVLFARTSLY
jgi:hypothetical protein